MEELNGLYRKGLPPIPTRLQRLPIERGYPVPWFVAKVDGKYDFRVADQRKLPLAVRDRLCWICGQKLGTHLAFPIGPMCAINRTSSEPPSHRECAEWSIKACPFLLQRQDERRTSGLPDGLVAPAGMMIRRQPAVSLLWITKRYRFFSDGRGGVLFRIGRPTKVAWYREGRAATREEVLASIESGYPILLGDAESEGPDAVEYLEKLRDDAMRLLPEEAA